MYKNSIDTSVQNPEKFSHKIEQITFSSVRKVLPNSAIIRACKQIGYKYRERKITPILTVLHMLMAAIWPEDSFNASWQVLWATFVSRVPCLNGKSPAPSNVARARNRLPIKLWRALFQWVSDQSQKLSRTFDKWAYLAH